MKFHYIAYLAFFVVLLSCGENAKDEANPQINGLEYEHYELDATFPNYDLSPIKKTGWEVDDVIFVLLSTQDAPVYVEMKWDGSKWVTRKFGYKYDRGDGFLTAIYLPFDSKAEISSDVYGNFLFSSISDTYYFTAQVPHSAGSSYFGTFDMQLPDGYVQFFLEDPNANPELEIELREPHITPIKLIDYVTNDGVAVYKETAKGEPLIGRYAYDNTGSGRKGYLFGGFLDEEALNNDINLFFTLVRGGWKGDYYCKEIDHDVLISRVDKNNIKTLPALSLWKVIDDCKPIDLGVDYEGRRIYVSSRNLGASADYPATNSLKDWQTTWGDYYAFGETEPYYIPGHAYDNPCTDWKPGKTGYNWESYKYNPSGDGKAFIKYSPEEWYPFISPSSLLPEDDAASVILGGYWHIPSVDEFGAFTDLTPSYGFTYDQYTNGWFFSGQAEGYTDHSVFLPCVGIRYDDQVAEPVEWNNIYSKSAYTKDYLKEDLYKPLIPPYPFECPSGSMRCFGISIRPFTY